MCVVYHLEPWLKHRPLKGHLSVCLQLANTVTLPNLRWSSYRKIYNVTKRKLVLTLKAFIYCLQANIEQETERKYQLQGCQKENESLLKKMMSTLKVYDETVVHFGTQMIN